MEFTLKPPAGNGKPARGAVPGAGARRVQKPDWADGLRKLYDSVVDEPLPASFDDLLKKLDTPGDS